MDEKTLHAAAIFATGKVGRGITALNG